MVLAQLKPKSLGRLADIWTHHMKNFVSASVAVVLALASLACSDLITDGGSETQAFATGVIRDTSGLPVQDAEVSLWQFTNPTCAGDNGGSPYPPDSSDAAGRFTLSAFYPFSAPMNGCVMVWASHTPTGTASDSIALPVSFRAGPPYDTVFVELTLAP